MSRYRFNQPEYFKSHRRHPLREMAESMILLALAVLLFRTFAAEGYLISTGSMAPTLLGYHRRVECPACHFAFARGAAFDRSESTANIANADFELGLDVYSATKCPNCSLTEINARVAPRNEGDQLLVHKLAYEFRDPQRWEVVVFQNQSDPAQAYLKRAVGLPGETVEVQDGEILINGRLARKPCEVQQAIKIPVSDYFHQPEDQDPDWRNRWVTSGERSSWQLEKNAIQLHSSDLNLAGAKSWLTYENWIRNGGNHETRVSLERWPASLKVPDDPLMRYEQGELVCVGVFTAFEKQQWQQKIEAPELLACLERLYSESHVAPIVDTYGYNSSEQRENDSIHDLMLSVTLEDLRGNGEIELQLTDGSEAFRVVLIPKRNQIALLRNEQTTPIWETEFVSQPQAGQVAVDFSLFDQQVIVAINEVPVHAPYQYVPQSQRAPLKRPVRIGAAGVDCRISKLQLFRDVYYTNKRDHAKQTYELGADEFFVLGDNSPVSLDSRVWENAAVPRHALIGKPFVVHLPSQQKEMNWRGKVRHVRVPDFSRIRYIR